MLPFQEHAASLAEYEATLGGGNSNNGAILQLALAPSPVNVPCTHTKIDGNFQLAFGKSPTTTVERCEFRSALIPQAQWQNVARGLKCTLTLFPGGPIYLMRLEAGGLVEGGQVFRFMLVDMNYKA